MRSKPFRRSTAHASRPRASSKSIWLPLLIITAWGGWSAATASVTLPDLESEHMVLQKSDHTAVWGTAAPGEKVTATLAGITGEAAAGADGKWRIVLDLSRVGAGPFDLVIAGTNKITISDVAVGEVWVASGQSNMEFPLSWSIDPAAEISTPANPPLRQFHVGSDPASTPQDRCKGVWVVADPSTIGSFTAVGYYFARCLQQTLHAPVGLILSAVGGSPCEAWTSLHALQEDTELKTASDRVLKDAADEPGLKAEYLRAYQEWEKRYDRASKTADPTPFITPGASLVDWKPVTLPGKVRDAGLPDAGTVWLRRTVMLRGDVVKRSQVLDLADLNGYETVYYNGKKVAEVTPDNSAGTGAPKRHYFGGSVEGENVFAIRVYNPTGGLGIDGLPGKLAYGTIPLAGEWLAKPESALPPLSAEGKQTCPVAPKAVVPLFQQPAALYNGMIHPLTASTIVGVIWYQGESNSVRAAQYQSVFPLLIKGWREGWGGEIPFYFCQLPAFGPKKSAVADYSSWAELRAAQTKTLSMPRTEEAVLIDLGESDDIHPRDKKPVGERLAAIALARIYGKEVPCSGPIYDSFKIEGNQIRIAFRETGSTLVAKPLPDTYVVNSLRGEKALLVRNRPGSELEGFAIRGVGHPWVWADARIENGTVVVSHPDVPQPTAVRYAWADNPNVNLSNQTGLPAAPFCTDPLPGPTPEKR